MPIPKSVQRQKKKARQPLPRARIYLPPEFEQGLAMRAGAAAALGAANTQIAGEATTAFIAIDRRHGGGLARPVSAKVAMQDYGSELRAVMGDTLDDTTLNRLHQFRGAPSYDAATGSVAITPDLTLVHAKTWRGLQDSLWAGLR